MGGAGEAAKVVAVKSGKKGMKIQLQNPDGLVTAGFNDANKWVGAECPDDMKVKGRSDYGMNECMPPQVSCPTKPWAPCVDDLAQCAHWGCNPYHDDDVPCPGKPWAPCVFKGWEHECDVYS